MNAPVLVPHVPRAVRHLPRMLMVMAALAFVVAEAAYQAGAVSGLDQAYTGLCRLKVKGRVKRGEVHEVLDVKM